MKYLSVLIIALGSQVLMGQDNELSNVNFAQLDTTMCQGKIVTTARFWEVYQTLNDQWDGEKDTTKCYNVSSNEYNGFISSHNFQFNKKIFLRYLSDTLKSLMPNKIYGASVGAYIPFGDYNQDCDGNDCSGLLLQLEHPDSTGTGRKTDEFFTSIFDNHGEFCFATDRFEDIQLKEFIFQFKWDGPRSDTISLWTDLQKVTYQGIVDNTIIEESDFTGEVYEINHSSLNSENSFAILLLNRDTLHYPSSEHIYYEDLQLALNKSLPQEIRINVYGTLLFQSFSQLRGGLVMGSDSIRHKISYYIPDHSSFCLYDPAELILEDGGNLILNNGQINFFAKDACVQISKGSKLIIDEGSHTVLGNAGKGILALRNGSEILLKNNASLTLDLKIEMHELKGETRAQNIYTYLSPGTHLSFTKNAMVSNQFSIDRQMKMYIFLNGGSVDMSELSIEEKSLIVIIDNKQNHSETDWTIFPVPVTTKLSYLNAKSEKANKVTIYNGAGQKISEENHPSEIDVSFLVPGVYYLIIQSDNKSESFKFIKE